MLPSLPSCQAVLIGNGKAKSGFLREGSHRVTACEVVVVDDKVMAVINTDGTGAVGVIERAADGERHFLGEVDGGHHSR